MNALFEFLPLILFLGALLYRDIYAAVVVLMVAMPIGLVVKYFRTGTFDKMYFWSTIFLLVAGGLTLYFRDPLFLKWKPTIFYWVVGAAFLVSPYVTDRPLVQRFLGLIDGLNIEQMSERDWRLLNIAWVAFFAVAGLLNIVVAYTVSLETWATFKVFGLMALTFVFMVGQTLWIARKVGYTETEETKETD